MKKNYAIAILALALVTVVTIEEVRLRELRHQVVICSKSALEKTDAEFNRCTELANEYSR